MLIIKYLLLKISPLASAKKEWQGHSLPLFYDIILSTEKIVALFCVT